jgi:hypothetical protein
MNYPKIMKKIFFSGYLRVIVFMSNILITMINYYDEKNVLTFDEKTQTIITSIQIKEEVYH